MIKTENQGSQDLPMYGGVRQRQDPGCAECKWTSCWDDGIPVTCAEMVEQMETESRRDTLRVLAR